MADQVVSFLTSKLDEAQLLAEAAKMRAQPPWTSDRGMVVAAATVDNNAMHPDRDLWDCEGAETLSMHPDVARFVASNDPDVVLRRVAADRKILEIHSLEEESIHEFTGDYEERVDSEGRTTRYFPPGSITGSRRVGTRYLCANCERSGDNEPWPCATVRALAEGWGYTGEENLDG